MNPTLSEHTGRECKEVDQRVLSSVCMAEDTWLHCVEAERELMACVVQVCQGCSKPQKVGAALEKCAVLLA
jgi:hypothetical protein